MSSQKICKHFVKTGTCSKGTECEYIHENNVCFYFFMNGTCRNGDACSKSHQFQYIGSRSQTTINQSQIQNKNKQNSPPRRQNGIKKKNTESFIPSYKQADTRIMYADGSNMACVYPHLYRSRDLFIVNNLFAHNENEMYEKLLKEINDTRSEDNDLWKLWHGYSHLIADDQSKKSKGWKEKCPTFANVIETFKNYFGIDIKATRFNWYRDGSDWKPLHFDAAAIDPSKAKTQNVTIGVSFGRTRSAFFENATTRTTMELPLDNGVTYGFCSAFNSEWRHGITQLTEEERTKDDSGRISIIAWGWVDTV